MNILLITGIGGAIAGALCGWQVHSWKADAEKLDALVAADMQRRVIVMTIDKAAEGFERDRVEIRTKFVTITQEVERVVEKPFYRDACFDDDGLRQLSAAIGATPAASQPAGTVPRPDGAEGRQ
jgi:hypothetical protein